MTRTKEDIKNLSRKLVVSLGHGVVTTESQDFLTNDFLLDAKLDPVTKVLNGGRPLGVQNLTLLSYQCRQSTSQASSAFIRSSHTCPYKVALK
jgi:hypothetical protein